MVTQCGSLRWDKVLFFFYTPTHARGTGNLPRTPNDYIFPLDSNYFFSKSQYPPFNNNVRLFEMLIFPLISQGINTFALLFSQFCDKSACDICGKLWLPTRLSAQKYHKIIITNCRALYTRINERNALILVLWLVSDNIPKFFLPHSIPSFLSFPILG